jgi:hypothetical protein
MSDHAVRLFIIMVGSNRMTDAFVLTEFFGKICTNYGMIAFDRMINAFTDIMQ